ncbi:MAG: toll/interleukin-1 receptor domain-containing protein [Candidatus Udaeobacter sp.]
MQVLIFRHTEDPDTVDYENAIVRAFQGGTESGGYLATGEDLGLPLRIFREVPKLENTVAQFLDDFSHSVTVVLLDWALLQKGGEQLWQWLVACWEHTRQSNSRHSMLITAMDERVAEQLIAQRPAFKNHQILQVHSLGERAIRPAVLALRVLHEGRLVLAKAVSLMPPAGKQLGYLRLFISHAKLDGLPLAHSLRHLIGRFKWLQAFYDADDLPGGCDWQEELEAGVGSSMIIMLRTENYDQRYWCQREVLWSEEYATPAVLVDARINLHHPAGGLPFDRAPTVRIPDGNLMRILFVALREGLRFLSFVRQVEQMKKDGDLPTRVELQVFSYPPGMSALIRACATLSKSLAPSTVRRIILYPDPPLRAGLYHAAKALVATYAPTAELLTPNTLTATPP